MQTCEEGGAEFAAYPIVDGMRMNFRGRRRCLRCRPHRPLRGPRKPVVRPFKQKRCEQCGRLFPGKAEIGGKVRSLYRRRFCLDCSPFGAHNTGKVPVAVVPLEELVERRRRRRNAKTYRWQKKKRRRVKADLIAARGGCCETCGYAGTIGALEFHHRDPVTKEFGVGNFSGARARLLAEVEKCDLVCANCHRMRHVLLDAGKADHPVAAHRRRRKARAVAYMGGTCFGCGRDGPPPIFEFHHWDAKEKDFGISESGIPRRWEKVVAELAKCVMLCANCHREVHAGVRELDEGLLGLADPLATYAA